MAHNLLNILLVFVFAFLTGCTQTQYGIINNDEKVVYVEVPVYIESEVPPNPVLFGLTRSHNHSQ